MCSTPLDTKNVDTGETRTPHCKIIRGANVELDLQDSIHLPELDIRISIYRPSEPVSRTHNGMAGPRLASLFSSTVLDCKLISQLHRIYGGKPLLTWSAIHHDHVRAPRPRKIHCMALRRAAARAIASYCDQGHRDLD